MGTAEILIVFSALMALIALVTIGIDWIGKPLKHRRFIPRIYRFDDEKLPIDAYGHAQLVVPNGAPAANGQAVAHDPNVPAHVQPPPTAVAHVPPNATVQVPVAPPVVPAPALAPRRSAATAGSGSAFSDNLGPDTDTHSGQRSTIAGTSLPGSEVEAGAASAASVAAAGGWKAGMALDASVEGRKPSLAVKAERFWTTTAAAIADSHFDDDNLTRMAAGKAPRRTNPRTGRVEAMQLTGLRRASTHTQVRMRWPDDAADPWAAS